mmetsp:Transcript_29684/g.102253  ORF Transcript_29684/g.102253 Transcript_29684/m.102253 type:complete len:227 (-) Transcript_29684:143-823(-)
MALSHSAAIKSSKSATSQRPPSTHWKIGSPFGPTTAQPSSYVRQRSSVGFKTSQCAAWTPARFCSRSVASSSGRRPQLPTIGKASKRLPRMAPSAPKLRIDGSGPADRPASWPCFSAASTHPRRSPGLPKKPGSTAASVRHGGPRPMPTTKSLTWGGNHCTSGRKPRLTPKRRPASPASSARSSKSLGRSRTSASLLHASSFPLTRICGQKCEARCAYSIVLKSAA